MKWVVCLCLVVVVAGSARGQISTEEAKARLAQRQKEAPTTQASAELDRLRREVARLKAEVDSLRKELAAVRATTRPAAAAAKKGPNGIPETDLIGMTLKEVREATGSVPNLQAASGASQVYVISGTGLLDSGGYSAGGMFYYIVVTNGKVASFSKEKIPSP